MASAETEKDILGFWYLKSWDTCRDNGEINPYSDRGVSGFLYYGSDAYMTVSIYEKEPAKLLTTYGGPYDVSGEKVIHRPLTGLSPNGIEDAKTRHIKRSGDDLIMETEWMGQQASFYKYRLCWVRSAV